MRMPVLIFGETDTLASWVASQIPHAADGFGPCEAIGIAASDDLDARFYGAVVFHDYQPRTSTIQVSAASLSPLWAHPGVIRALLHYPFQQLHVRKLWMAIPHDNGRALKFNLGLGFVREGLALRHHFAWNRHAVILSMMEPEYRASRWCWPRDAAQRNHPAREEPADGQERALCASRA